MSYRIRTPPRKSPVGEAQLMSSMERLWLSAEEHRRGILAGLVVVLLAIGIVIGVVWYDMERAQTAMSLHVEANKHFATRPPDKPEQAQKNLKKAILLYREVAKDYPGTSAAAQSLFRLGLALEEDKNVPEAIEAYQKLVTRHGDNDALLGLAYQRLAYAYLDQGDGAKADEALTAVLAVPGAINKDHALFELGKLEEAQSRPEGALARFQELIDRHPYSPLANEASIRIKALAAQQEPSETEAQPSGKEDLPAETDAKEPDSK